MADFSLIDHESREERIRELAFRLWQDDGGPEGMDQEYWYRAARIVDAELGRFSGSPAADPPGGAGKTVQEEGAATSAPTDETLTDAQLEKRLKKYRAI